MEQADDLYREHASAVLGFARRLVGDRDRAEDLAADAFVALLEHGNGLDGAVVGGWLRRVVRNRAIDQWRRRSTERRLAHLQPSAPVWRHGDAAEWLEGCHALRPLHRVCLLLQLEGRSVEEISAMIGISPTRVKGYLQYGRAILRRFYNPTSKKGRALRPSPH